MKNRFSFEQCTDTTGSVFRLIPSFLGILLVLGFVVFVAVEHSVRTPLCGAAVAKAGTKAPVAGIESFDDTSASGKKMTETLGQLQQPIGSKWIERSIEGTGAEPMASTLVEKGRSNDAQPVAEIPEETTPPSSVIFPPNEQPRNLHISFIGDSVTRHQVRTQIVANLAFEHYL